MTRNPGAAGLAAFGILRFKNQKRLFEAGQPRELLQQKLSRAVASGVARCLLTPHPLTAEAGADRAIGELEELWHAVVSDGMPAGLALGLELVGQRGRPILTPMQAAGLAASLLSAEGVASVFFSDRSLPADGPWHWPLKIGFLADTPSAALRAETTELYYHHPLIDVCQLKAGGPSCDLVLLPALPSDEQIAQLERTRAGAALIVPAAGEPLPDLDHLLRLRDSLRLSAVGTLGVADNATAAFATLLDCLSHDQRLDQALIAAAGGAAECTLIAQPKWLAATTISALLHRAAANARRASPRDDDLDLLDHRELRTLKKAARSLGFRHEGGLATEVATRVRSMRSARASADARADLLDMPGAPEPRVPRGRHGSYEEAAILSYPPKTAKAPPTKPARWLQSQVFAVAGAERKPRRHAFRAGAAHEIRIRIGPHDTVWTEMPVAFPDKDLPPGQKHELDVVVTPVDTEAAPQRASITLWPEGPSSEATFAVDVPADAADFQLQVDVLHKGRYLQSGRLSGKVRAGDDDSDAGADITFRCSSPAQSDPAHQRPADLTLACAKDVVVVLTAGREPVKRAFPDLQKRVAKLRDALFEASKETAWLESGLTEGAGLELIRTLAIVGRFLEDKLFEGIPVGPAAKHIEVVSQCSGNSFPVEFLYDFEAPDDDAPLCDKFVDPQGGPVCADCVARGSATRICPYGFWGLNRTIGRQIYQLQGDLPESAAAPESSTTRPQLPPLKSVQMGASARVNNDTPGLVAATFQHVLERSANSAQLADTWADWKTGIGRAAPTLLLLLPHNHASLAGLNSLEIGDGNLLRLDRVTADYVNSGKQDRVPIVLLLGCSTAAAEVGFEDFILEFRKNGAAIVVGTSSPVLGRQAAPVASEFVDCLLDPTASGTAFGEVMQKARSNLLKKGNVMALTLVAYGDADWKLA